MKKFSWGKIYLISLSLFIFEEVFRRSMYMEFAWAGMLNMILMALSCGGALCKLTADFFGKRLSFRKILLMGMPALACAFLILRGKTGVFMFLLLFSAAGHDVPYDKVAKVFSAALMGSVLFVIFSCLAGMIRETDLPQLRSGAFRSRLGCGFEYYYMASHYVFFAVLAVLYGWREKIGWIALLVLTGIVFYVYGKADTKMPFYLSLLGIGIFAVLKLIPFLRKYHALYGAAAILAYPAATASVLLVTVFMDPESLCWQRLNGLTTGRMGMNLNGYREFGLKLFGNDIVWQTGEEFYNLVDSSYLSYLYEYGILFLVAALSVCVVLGIYCHKRKDTYYALFTCVIAGYAVLDNWWMRPECNLFFMAFPYICTVIGELTESKVTERKAAECEKSD